MKSMIMLAIAGVAGVILTVKTAQAQTAPWLESFNYQGLLDEAVDVAVDVYGNSYVVGYGTHPSQGRDIIVVKYGRNGGNPIGGPWVWNGTGNGDDVPVRIHVDKAAKYVWVFGTTYSGPGTQNDYVVIKLDAETGDRVWTNGPNIHQGGIRTSGANHEEAADMAVDDAGNVFVTGSIGIPNVGGSWDYYTVVYDQDPINPASVTIRAGWPVQRDHNGQDDFGVAIGVDSAGKVIVTGQVAVSQTHDRQWWTIKYPASGGLQPEWQKPYGNVIGEPPDVQKTEAPTDLVIDKDDSIYVCGYVDMRLGELEDLAMAAQKYLSNGDEPWNEDGFPGTVLNSTAGDDRANAIRLECNPAGGAIAAVIAGEWAEDSPSNTAYGVARLAATTGAPTWTPNPVVRYNPTGARDLAKALALRGLGNIFATGWIRYEPPLNPNSDVATVAYRQDGTSRWSFPSGDAEVLATAARDGGNAIALFAPGWPVLAALWGTGNGDMLTAMRSPETVHTAPVTGVQIVIGTHDSGGISAFAAADNTYYSVIPDTTQLTQAQVVLSGVVSTTNGPVTELAFRLEAHATDQGVVQRIEFFNFTNNRWDAVDIDRGAAIQSQEEDKQITVTVPCDPTEYVGGNDVVQVRVSYWNFTSVSPRVRFDLGQWIWLN